MIILQPQWINILNYFNMGWKNENEAGGIFNTHPGGVYSFVLSQKCPQQDEFAFDIKETVYIGMAGGSGGEDGCFRLDNKSGDGVNPVLKTKLRDRLWAHLSWFHKAGMTPIHKHLKIPTPKNKKYIIYHNHLMQNPDHTLWINLLVPDRNLSLDTLGKFRPEHLAVEAECVMLYKNRFGDAPMMNLGSSWKELNKNPQSFSETYKTRGGKLDKYDKYASA